MKYTTYNKIYQTIYDPKFVDYQQNTSQTVNYTGVEDIDIGWIEVRVHMRQTTPCQIMDSDLPRIIKKYPKTNILERDGFLVSTLIRIFDYIEGWDFIDDDNDPYDFKAWDSSCRYHLK